jgi:hypothetical protein
MYASSQYVNIIGISQKLMRTISGFSYDHKKEEMEFEKERQIVEKVSNFRIPELDFELWTLFM